MANEAPGQTLQPTARVHEAWLRLAGPGQQAWHNRARFFEGGLSEGRVGGKRLGTGQRQRNRFRVSH